MTPKQLIINQLESARFLFDNFMKDLTDGDAAFQPCEGGIHLNWILVHLAGSEDHMISQISGQPKRLSEALHKNYEGGSTCKADDGMTFAEARKLYNESCVRTMEFVKGFDEARYDDKAPEGYPPIFPNVGAIMGLIATHPFWHVGQLTVNRKLLGKPRIWG